jgi:hypothetical protein
MRRAAFAFTSRSQLHTRSLKISGFFANANPIAGGSHVVIDIIPVPTETWSA